MKNIINILLREAQELRKELKNTQRISNDKDNEIKRFRNKVRFL